MTAATRNIVLVCPGGRITQDIADKTADIAARRHGERLRLTFHPQCFLEAGHFAGDDAARSAAFLEAANDPAFDAVWFARGGYGAGRLADDVYEKLEPAAGAKTYLGYSDAGVILARLLAAGVGEPVHGPIPVDLARPRGETAIARALDYLALGKTRALGALEPHAAGARPVVAFNLTVLVHMIGFDWFPDLAGCLVMVEDVGEYLYRIDRAMAAVLLHPKMRGAIGLRLGRISDIPDNDRPFGADAEEIAQYWCARASVPYLGRADIGHDADNRIVPFFKPRDAFTARVSDNMAPRADS